VALQTKAVARDVNPVIAATLILDEVSDTDRLQFRIKDVGMLAEERMVASSVALGR
jgi:hypothetical protein